MTALESALAKLARERGTIDAISFCGNGEPTLYPALGEVIVAAKQLRDRYQPAARVVIFRTLRRSPIPRSAKPSTFWIARS